MYERKPFSVAEGLKVQEENLIRWKRILKDEIYESVVAQLLVINAEATLVTGYDVTRGQMVDELVMKHMYNN